MSMTLNEARDQIEFLHGPVLDVVSDLVRGVLTATPGKVLISGDYSQIEARIVAWLAGQEDILEVFRTHGKIYEYTASQIYSKPIDQISDIGSPSERFIGKTATLALGFGGAEGAFVKMAETHGAKIAPEKARIIVKQWRERNRNIVQLWADYEDAAIAAVLNSAVAFKAGKRGRQVAFRKVGTILHCQLPSGRTLQFHSPRVEPVEHPYPHDAVTYMVEQKGQWVRISGWGGLFTENITQATARDYMAGGMLRLEDAGYEIVWTVHDEVPTQVYIDDDTKTAERAESLMVGPAPLWAKDLPVDVKAWRGQRYRKG